MVHLAIEDREKLREVIENIFKLRERGLSYRQIAKNLGVSRYFVSNVLGSGSVEKAMARYEKYLKPKEEGEEPVEERMIKQSTKAVMKEIIRHSTYQAVENLRRIYKNGLLVEQYAEELLQRRLEIYRKRLVWERLLRDALDFAILAYLAGYINRYQLGKIATAIYYA